MEHFFTKKHNKLTSQHRVWAIFRRSAILSFLLLNYGIQPMPLTKPLASYPHIRQVGDLYFLAGQGCRDPDTDQCTGLIKDALGETIGYDIDAQTRGVFSNIKRVLQSVGLEHDDLIDVTVFLTSMDDFSSMNEVWNEFFSSSTHPPTRTTIAVAKLPGENYIEMKAIACRRR